MRSYLYSCRRYIAAAFAIILSVALVAKIVTASNIAYYSLTFTYDQSSAREMLSSLNQWRTGKNWYWNPDNKTKTSISAGKLGNLQWDYNLEQIAMQRAYEIVLLAEHKRPNGDSVFSITVRAERISRAVHLILLIHTRRLSRRGRRMTAIMQVRVTDVICSIPDLRVSELLTLLSATAITGYRSSDIQHHQTLRIPVSITV